MTLQEFKKKTETMNIDEFSAYVWDNFGLRVPDPCYYINAPYGLFAGIHGAFCKDLKSAIKGVKNGKHEHNCKN